MAQNVIINGVTYQSVPEVDIPLSGGGTAKFYDTSAADVTPQYLLGGVTAYGANGEVFGSIPLKPAATYTPTTSDQTIAALQYLSGIQTVEGIVVAGLTPSVIANGVTVKVGTATDDDSVGTWTGTLSSAVISQDSTTKILSIS